MNLLQTSPATVVEAPPARTAGGARRQRTLAGTAEVHGVGMVTSKKVKPPSCPPPPVSGVVFLRPALPGTPPTPARVDAVPGTPRRTTLGHSPNQVTLVEPVLAALAGRRVDNCLVEI